MGQENFPVMWGEGENLILWTCPPIAIPISLDPQKNFLPKIGRKLKGEIGHNFWKKMPMYSCTWASSTLLFFTFFFGFFFFLLEVAFFVLFFFVLIYWSGYVHVVYHFFYFNWKSFFNKGYVRKFIQTHFF